MGSLMEEEQVHHETAPLPKPQPHLSHNLGGFPVSTFPVTLSAVSHVGERQVENLPFMRTTSKPIRPIPILPVPPSSKLAELNLNQKETLPLSLRLSPASSDEQSPPPPPPGKHSSAFQAMSGNFSSYEDSIISVA